MQPKAIWGMSRRAWLPLLVAAVLTPAILVLTPAPVVAQTKHEYKFNPAKLSWQEYRRDDLGFRIEMPGAPEVMADESPDKLSKETSAELMFDRVTFAVIVRESPQIGALTFAQADEELVYFANCLEPLWGVKPKLTRFTMNGTPGLEFIFERKDWIMHYRAVVYGGSLIVVSVDDSIGQAAQRFLKSFALLPVPR